MKKFVAILFVCALIVAMSMTAFAATGLNANEKAVLEMLQGGVVIGENNETYKIPQSYINTAKNYFLGDCDMTEEEKDRILAYIEAGAAVIKSDADAKATEHKTFSLSAMSDENRAAVLDLGQKACAEVDLTLTYAPADNKVIITPVESDVPVFESAPVIKVTGEDFALNAGSVCVAVVLVMVVGSAVMFAISKKNGLLV